MRQVIFIVEIIKICYNQHIFRFGGYDQRENKFFIRLFVQERHK